MPWQPPDSLLGPRTQVRAFRAGDAEALWQAIDSSREHLGVWLGWARAYGSRAAVASPKRSASSARASPAAPRSAVRARP
jgi:hypothetical protein